MISTITKVLLFSYLLTVSLAQPRRCNIKVCFALDSSSGIPEQFFGTTKKFVSNVVERLQSRSGSRVRLAAMQYSTTANAIFQLTPYLYSFNKAVEETIPDGQEGTFVTAGLNYCIRQLLSDMQGGMKSVIVVVGSGESSIGTDPSKRSELLQEIGVEAYSVGVGSRQDIRGLMNIAGSSRRVLTIAPGEPVWVAGLKLMQRMCDNHFEN